jgi:outer membrane lipoprotein-sorting protein
MRAFCLVVTLLLVPAFGLRAEKSKTEPKASKAEAVPTDAKGENVPVPEVGSPEFPIPARGSESKKAVAKAAVANPHVEKMQKAWDEAKTFQATFKQVSFDKRLGTREETSGTFSLSKPSRLRWDATSDQSVQILDGKKLYVIHQNRRRNVTVVDIYSNLGKAIDSKSLAFLAGKSRFADLYDIELVGSKGASFTFKFVSKTPGGETLTAEVDKTTYLLRSLTSDAADLRTRTEFSDIKTNVRLDDQLFVYKPKPTDVVHNN